MIVNLGRTSTQGENLVLKLHIIMGNGAAWKKRDEKLFENITTEKMEKLIMVARYTHPLFQLDIEPEISPEIVQMCKDAFEMLSTGKTRVYARAKAKNANILEPLCFMAEDFYNTMFERIPSSKALFNVDIGTQAKMLTAVLRAILDVLSFDSEAVSIFEDLAHSHNKLKIHPSYYGEFAYTFICTMRKHLGRSFTEEAETAWVSLFSYVLKIMIPIAVDGILSTGKTKVKWRSETDQDTDELDTLCFR